MRKKTRKAKTKKAVEKKVDEKKKIPKVEENVITSYCVSENGFPADIRIAHEEKEFVPTYNVKKKRIEQATMAVLERIREKLIKDALVEESMAFQ